MLHGMCTWLQASARCARAGMAAFKALWRRELILIQRLAFVYVFKAVQAAIVAIIVATMFLRTHIHPNNARDASLLSGMLFFSLLQTFFSGIAEMTFTVRCCPPRTTDSLAAAQHLCPGSAASQWHAPAKQATAAPA